MMSPGITTQTKPNNPFLLTNNLQAKQVSLSPSFSSQKSKFQLKEQPTIDILEKTKEQPAISTIRAIFRRIPKDVIKTINETGQFPKNMMVTEINGHYVLVWKNPLTKGKIIGGTQKMPSHLELRNNLLGFTAIYPKGYDHWFLNPPA